MNVATYMMADAFRKDCDQLVVITNDSDLAEPIRIINKELGMPVGVFNPHTRASIKLKQVAKFNRDITSRDPSSHMALSQFPLQLTDAQGRIITKPADW